MTTQEAIDILYKSVPEAISENYELPALIGRVKEAIEKQIPKKIISFQRTGRVFQGDTCKHNGRYCEHIKPFSHEYKYTDYKCPVCGFLPNDAEANYCWNCGQALDWRDEK